MNTTGIPYEHKSDVYNISVRIPGVCFMIGSSKTRSYLKSDGEHDVDNMCAASNGTTDPKKTTNIMVGAGHRLQH